MKLSSPRLQRVLCFVTILLYYSFLFVQHIYRRHAASITYNFDSDVLATWTDYIEGFSVQPKDRYAMHEMGFRTSVLTSMLDKYKEENVELASRLQLALWEFLPSFADDTRLYGEKRDIMPLIGSKKAIKIVDYLQDRIRNFARNRRNARKKRGIVTVVESDNIRSSVELITTIRYSLKDDTNIEVYYLGDENLPELIRDAFSMMPGVRTIDLNSLSDFTKEGLDGFWLKNTTQLRSTALQSLALLMSDFDEIIYAAPGVIFLEKPNILFSQSDFKRTGTYFFRGLNTPQLADSNRFLNYLRQQFDRAHPSIDLASSPFYNFGIDKHQDSRVLALDKSRPSVFSSLLLNAWMHSPSVRESIWHAHFPQSLTETIWLSFELSKAPYHFEPAFPGAIGHFEGPIDDLPWQPTICPAHVLHYVGRKTFASRGGKPLWMDGGLKLFPHHEQYLDIQAFSPRGRWEQTNLGMCLIGADARSPTEYDLKTKLDEHKLIDETFIDIFSTIFDVYGLSIL